MHEFQIAVFSKNTFDRVPSTIMGGVGYNNKIGCNYLSTTNLVKSKYDWWVVLNLIRFEKFFCTIAGKGSFDWWAVFILKYWLILRMSNYFQIFTYLTKQNILVGITLCQKLFTSLGFQNFMKKF